MWQTDKSLLGKPATTNNVLHEMEVQGTKYSGEALANKFNSHFAEAGRTMSVLTVQRHQLSPSFTIV